ncbi:MAG: hypothetical protein GY903_12265 [Fuerstiella sp.]|nr:hypothetical protein [Fuerstiella sp.]MCP4855256.1 hypothetical protein [Fuerstiella sp.]
MRSTTQKRRDEFFAKHSGKPLVRGTIRRNWNGRGDFTRHYGQSIVMFTMRTCALNQQLDEANAAVRELCEYHLERPKTFFEIHSFPSVCRGLARLYHFYGPHGLKTANRLSKETCALLEKTMWEWLNEKSKFEEAEVKHSKTWWIHHSENHHANHFTTCWLFSGILRNSPVYRDNKFKAGRTPTEHYQAWTIYLKEYLRQRARKGMFIEIDSPSYATVVINTMYDCYDFSDDPVLKRRAGQLLELYWAQWAEQQIDAVTGGAKTRCYSDKIFSSCGFLLSAACYAMGSREAELYHLSMVPSVTTSWRVPDVVLRIAANRGSYVPYEVLQRRPGLVLEGYHRPPDYRLKINSGGILRYTYCTPDFIMGSLITEARPDEDWAAISSQNRWAGVVFKGHPDARVFAVPYDDKGSKALNGFWSLQSKGTTITQKLTQNPRGWRVFFSNAGLSEPVKRGSWFFAEAESAYVGVRIVNGKTTWEAHEAGRWLVCSDPKTPVIIEAARKADHKSFTAFQDTLTARLLSFKRSVLTYQSLGGATLTFYADKSRIGEVNGTPVNLAPQNVYDSPFVKSNWDSGVVTLQCGEERRMLDLNE